MGDATVSRLYKDGIGSALLTAREAAQTAVYHGISRQDFTRYYRPLCNRIHRDNRWGHLLFLLNDKVKDSRAFVRAQQRLIGDEQKKGTGSRLFTRAAWGMFTGSYSYRSIAWMIVNPPSLVRLSLALIRESFSSLFGKRVVSPRTLHISNRKVLILGSGFGGTYVLRHLVPSLNQNENVEITMASDENFFLFSPLLHEVAMGGVETRHIAYPVRRLHWRDRFNFIQASVTGIDLGGRKVTTSGGMLDFDYLVMALGSVTDTSELSSRAENVFTLKTLYDSMLIRNHIIDVFEQASVEKEPEKQKRLLTFVVSGAGYVGIQVVTELRDFIYRNLIRFYKDINVANIKIMLIEVKPRLLDRIHPRLAAYVTKHLQRVGIEIRTNSRVTSIWDDGIEINSREKIPTNTVLWVAGVLANPQIAALEVKKDKVGRVLVNEYLEVPGVPGVYAVGDCAHFKDPGSGEPIPPRAHTAVRQAKVVAHNILAEIRGRDKKPYRYSQSAEIISLGASKAILRFHRLRIYGFTARFIWLAAYSTLITGSYNRLRILMDWLLSFLFGRDTTLLKLGKLSDK
ncbi:MAG: NAD(P)/FAD-dependent oxidoreductase [Chloroflexi bacterium]|nr:NAD(P)/FAD-dependent oxidoreductase [Chloroflexota bacterium]